MKEKLYVKWHFIHTVVICVPYHIEVKKHVTRFNIVCAEHFSERCQLQLRAVSAGDSFRAGV